MSSTNFVKILKATVVNHDGSPVQDKTNPLIIKKKFGWNEENSTETKHFLDDNGMVHFSETVAEKDGFSLVVRISFFQSFILYIVLERIIL